MRGTGSSVAAGMLLAFLLLAPPAHALCSGGTGLPGFAGKRIVLADDTLFFRTEEVQLDLDGAPRAYGVRDQGIEDICNGLAPLEPPECKGKNKGECYRPCRSAFAAWSGNDIAQLGDQMCSIGLGGWKCSKPEVRLQDPPNDDWFVSETKVQVAPPPGMRVSSWIRTQPAQLDPLELPYFVIPSGFRARPWDATPGDAGVILNRKTGTAVAFVIGDTGGSLDEGSAKLLAKLRGLSTLPTAMKVSALGERVERVRGALNGDFRVAIFRHSAPLLPRSRRGGASVLDQTSADLPSWIEQAAAERLAKIGGIDRLLSCTGS